MSLVDLVRVGVAGVASLGAAVSGFAASQASPEVIGVAVPRPPALPEVTASVPLPDAGHDLARWAEAFEQQPAPLTVDTSAIAPWKFIGVIGDGSSARAVFAAPDNPAMTILVRVGETLPDGRVIAAVASQHVLFAAQPEQRRAGGVEAASGLIGPTQINLFAADQGNAEAAAAFSRLVQARLEPAAMRITAAALYDTVEAHNVGMSPTGRTREPASAH